MHPIAVRQAAIFAVAAAFAACEPPEPPGAEAGRDDSAIVALSAADFAPVNRSDITGTARFEGDAEEATVTVELVGLEPGAVYAAQLHTGRCAAGGPTAVPLGRITAGEDRRGRLTAPIAATDLSPDEPVFIQVEGPDGNAVACADVGGGEGGDAEDGAGDGA